MRRFMANDLVKRIILILGDRNANLDSPVIVRYVSRNFGLQLPAKAGRLVGTTIEIDQRSSWVHSDLVVAVGIGMRQRPGADCRCELPEDSVIL
jgi:hypothetical protein